MICDSDYGKVLFIWIADTVLLNVPGNRVLVRTAGHSRQTAESRK